MLTSGTFKPPLLTEPQNHYGEKAYTYLYIFGISGWINLLKYDQLLIFSGEAFVKAEYTVKYFKIEVYGIISPKFFDNLA